MVGTSSTRVMVGATLVPLNKAGLLVWVTVKLIVGKLLPALRYAAPTSVRTTLFALTPLPKA